MSKFDTIDYLKTGSQNQRNAYGVLTANKILEKLSEFTPILTGTIPIGIDTEESDLDIICYWTDITSFKNKLLAFSNQNDFKIYETEINGFSAIIAEFFVEEFKIEVFGQNRPSKEQNSYRHMIIEDQIIQKFGENFRKDIIDLKKKGIKTEPAFGILLGLKGNPYVELLKYKI